MTQSDAHCSLLLTRDMTPESSIIANVWASWLHRNRASPHLNGLSISAFLQDRRSRAPSAGECRYLGVLAVKSE
jgi:hypothetical protein